MQQQIKLTRTSTLINQSLIVFKNKIWTLVGLFIFRFLIGLLIYIIPAVLLFWSASFLNKEVFILSTVTFIVIIILVPIASLIIDTWVKVSSIYAVKEINEKTGIKRSLGLGKNKIFSYLWINILLGLIVVVGYILLIIPGIIFSVWLGFAVYVLISEEVRGSKALYRSKELVKGYWWGVFWRDLLASFFVILLMAPVFIIYLFSLMTDFYLLRIIMWFLGVFVSFFSVNFFIIFNFLLYKNLKQIKGRTDINI